MLENYSDAPMTPKQILHVIETEGLKEMRSVVNGFTRRMLRVYFNVNIELRGRKVLLLMLGFSAILVGYTFEDNCFHLLINLSILVSYFPNQSVFGSCTYTYVLVCSFLRL